MAFQAKKIEHSGAKKGSGAYWGRVRREDDKKIIFVEDMPPNGEEE